MNVQTQVPLRRKLEATRVPASGLTLLMSRVNSTCHKMCCWSDCFAFDTSRQAQENQGQQDRPVSALVPGESPGFSYRSPLTIDQTSRMRARPFEGRRVRSTISLGKSHLSAPAQLQPLLPQNQPQPASHSRSCATEPFAQSVGTRRMTRTAL